MKITTKSKITYIKDSSLSDSSSAAEEVKSQTVGGKIQAVKKKSRKLKLENRQRNVKKGAHSTGDSGISVDEDETTSTVKETKTLMVKNKTEGRKADFTRVDRVFDKDSFRFVLRQSSEKSEVDEFRKYALIIKRGFNYDDEHTETRLDIVSKPLRASLERVMEGAQSVSLKGDSPSIDPNTAFLFLDDLRTEIERLKTRSKAEKAGQRYRQSAREAKHLNVLVGYLLTDYDETMKTLDPLLESGKITFDLLWALFKSNEIMYAPTYGVKEEPWVFRLEHAHKDVSTESNSEYYTVEGRYLDYNGKAFGMGKVTFTVRDFKGPRKISNLACFPFKYHPEYPKLKPDLIQRGKKFVALKGQTHRLLDGRAFQKSKLEVKKFIINGRVMIDPATFRRFNPDYHVSALEFQGKNLGSDSGVETSAESESSSGEDGQSKTKGKRPITGEGIHQNDIDELSDEDTGDKLSDKDTGEGKFTDDQYLIASPVVLGYSLSEKIWIEIAVSGIRHIEWDVNAFASLVIPSHEKIHLKALVEAHSGESDKQFDDIIRGKGLGLIVLLYGPPGTGKTLTAESISEVLEKPLYTMTMGELGAKQGDLEKNVGVTFELASKWKAVLLIDEAEVFMEQRQAQNTARNVLVSIFLRKLEYFPGVLMLTTNYPDLFDEAVLSRINTGIKFSPLDVRARKKIWRLFIDRARASPDANIADITEEDYENLSRHELNGRTIKNAFRTATAVAQLENQELSMEHLNQALDSGSKFAEDMKGQPRASRGMYV